MWRLRRESRCSHRRRIAKMIVVPVAVASMTMGVASKCLRGSQHANAGYAFTQAAAWAEQAHRTQNDTLPLLADITFDFGQKGSGKDGSTTPNVAGRGSYIADFGIINAPMLGDIRARAGLRYSRLYPHGALELGMRKELRSDEAAGYELHVSAMSAGDDRRLDALGDFSVLKRYKGAEAFYSFRCGAGGPYDQEDGRYWTEMGSRLGVVQTQLPPGGLGELTVGWRTGLFDNELEGVARPVPSKDCDAAKQGKLKGLLDSTPYAAFGMKLPKALGGDARVSVSVLPEHNLIEHSVQMKAAADSSGGAATFTATIDQSMSNLADARLHLGASYLRG